MGVGGSRLSSFFLFVHLKRDAWLGEMVAHQQIRSWCMPRAALSCAYAGKRPSVRTEAPDEAKPRPSAQHRTPAAGDRVRERLVASERTSCCTDPHLAYISRFFTVHRGLLVEAPRVLRIEERGLLGACCMACCCCCFEFFSVCRSCSPSSVESCLAVLL